MPHPGLQAVQPSTVEMPLVSLLLSTSPRTLPCLQLSQHLGYPVMRENVMKKKSLLKNWIVIIQVIILNQPLFAHLVVSKLEEVITCLTSGGTMFDVHLTSCWRSILIHRCGRKFLQHPVTQHQFVHLIGQTRCLLRSTVSVQQVSSYPPRLCHRQRWYLLPVCL